MIRGTTPKHYFTAPCAIEIIDKVNLLYKQGEVLILKKTTDDFTMEDDIISTSLTREESLLFDEKVLAKVQAVIETKGGEVIESLVKTFGVGELLDDGEIE